ncbi:hypothetical protein JCM19232_5265 [Vibrio ishigakensis]|uniref:Uncharacterized protein n=1 Tax=Vibrio ishigakensis TaxID=1481914 RepID=A0A0B8P7L5_9VIBR|nr:hypothetical protein JCM19232_5265 [Vibrio ishigakensis]
MLDKAKQSMKDDLDIIDGDIRIALSSDLGETWLPLGLMRSWTNTLTSS